MQEYAAAAAASGISFLAFLEPYTALTNASFSALLADCKSYSTPNLLLWAGWTIDTNIGDHYFGYGPKAELPPPALVDNTSRFIIQPRDPKDPRNFTGMNGPSFSWLLVSHLRHFPPQACPRATAEAPPWSSVGACPKQRSQLEHWLLQLQLNHWYFGTVRPSRLRPIGASAMARRPACGGQY